MEAFVNVEKAAGPSQNQSNGNQKNITKNVLENLIKNNEESCIICSEPICDSHTKFICIEYFKIKNKLHLLEMCCYLKFNTI